MGEGPSRFWSLRWHLAPIVWGNPTWFLAGLGDGLRVFRRAFFCVWDPRWKATDRDELKLRVEALRSLRLRTWHRVSLHHPAAPAEGVDGGLWNSLPSQLRHAGYAQPVIEPVAA